MPQLRPLLALVLLAGCAATAEPPAASSRATPAGALRSTDADGAACLSQGHPVGTDDFARCLLRLAEQRRAGIPPDPALKPDDPVKVGDWCYTLATPEPFVCYDI